MERITTATQAKKYIGQKLQWRPRTSVIWRESVLHEVIRKNVRLGGDWRWLPDILLTAPHATDPALPCTGSNEPGQPGSKYTTPTPGDPTDA